MCDLCLRSLAPDERSDWPEQLIASASFTALDQWMSLVHEFYGLPIYRFETRRGDLVTALLALAHIQHPIFGNYLVTAPFGSYGGFAYSDLSSRDLILEEARQLASNLKAKYANIRFDAGDQHPPVGWVQSPIYSTYLLDLPPAPESLFSTFSPDHRNHVRKSLRKGFTIAFGKLSLLEDAYRALAMSMHELGSPFHARTYLQAMAELLGDRIEFAVVYTAAGEIAGAGVFVLHGSTVSNLHANILQAFRPNYPGEFLYWSVIERYALRGFKVLDLGRSLIGSGNETFKMKWKPCQRNLSYWYALQPGVELPALHPKNPKFAHAIDIWKHLPTFVVAPLGPFLIKGLA